MTKMRFLAATLALTGVVLAGLGTSAKAQTPIEAVVFDTITGATGFSFPGSPGRTFVGQSFNAADPAFASTRITRMDVFFASSVTQALTGMRVNVRFWNNFNSGATDVFSTPISTTTFTFTGVTGATPLAVTANQIRTATLTFGTPISLTGFQNLGVTFNWERALDPTGTAWASNDDLTTVARGGGTNPGFAVGSVPGLTAPNYGYYRNASGRTDYNFASTDGRQLGVNTAVAVRMYGLVVPEANTMALASCGLMGLVGVVARRRRK